MDAWVVAVLVGLVQGVLEWLPVSSEGATALVLTLAGDTDATAAVQYALFLHAGTAVAAVAYYRRDLRLVLSTVRGADLRAVFADDTAELAFLATATGVSVVVALLAYGTLMTLATDLAGGAFVALVGGLLVLTGLVQRAADARAVSRRDTPSPLDAVVVGGLQGLAILPGISRSGTTVSALLLRGHEGNAALRLSFLLSVPAALGAGTLAVLDGGVSAVDPMSALLALVVSAVVGYLTVGALVALVERVTFWAVCVGFGTAAVGGGVALVL